MLDAVRYMVVWNPIVLLGLHLCMHVLGVDKRQQMLHEHSEELHRLHMANLTLSLNSTAGLNDTLQTVLTNVTDLLQSTDTARHLY